MTIREIADRAGVSIATVSRVLNGRADVAGDPRAVAASSRRTATRPTAAPGASPRAAPGSSASSSHSSIRPTSPACSPARPRRSAERDLQIVLSPTQGRARARGLRARAAPRRTDGALIIKPEESTGELERLLDRGYRFVVLDPLMALERADSLRLGREHSGADQAMRHLLQLGHRRIAQITGPAGWVATEGRRRGYRAALASAGILPDPALEVEAIPEIEPGPKAAETLLDLPDPPTAIFAFNDNIAIGAIQAAPRPRRARAGGPVGRRLRRRRARDDRDAGADDGAPAARRNGPTAVSLLGRLLKDQRFEALHVELATRLVVRDSTAPPPNPPQR